MKEIPSQTPPSLLVREKDLPALLNVSRASIRRAMEAGRFPKCIRIGRCVMWRRAEIEAWVEASCPAVK